MWGRALNEMKEETKDVNIAESKMYLPRNEMREKAWVMRGEYCEGCIICGQYI